MKWKKILTGTLAAAMLFSNASVANRNVMAKETAVVSLESARETLGTLMNEAIEKVNIEKDGIKTSAEYNKKGLHCCVTSWRRISDETLSPRIKCGANYMNSRVGQREAIRNGYDTCIFLNEAGKVAEGPGSCLFIVKNDTLITPQLTDSVLESITRDSIIQIARKMDINVVERSIDRTELYTCDEAFLCGSAMEITPVLSIDRYEIGNSITGLITKNIHMEYLNVARGIKKNFKDWVTPIYAED